MYFIIIQDKEKELEITIIKEKMVTFLITKTNEIDSYAVAIHNALDFFNECEVNVFTGNIFVTNTLNEWMDKVSQQHQSWKQVVDKKTERNVVLNGFTAYKKVL
jgi:hypothetical protein